MKLNALSLAAVFAASVSTASLQGCASPSIDPAVADASNPATVKAFEGKLASVAHTLPSEPGYKRIPLDTKPDQDWFTTQAFLLWDKKISVDTFVQEGEKRFPGYASSFKAVASKLLN